MIAGGAYDRLIGWTGNHNTFIVPFSPWGEPTVTRSPSPHDEQFLTTLGAADGADNLYADYNAPGLDNITGLDPARNGEPYGELAIITQHDVFWTLEHGAPNQPPPGNIAGGARLVTGKFTGTTSSTVPAPLTAVTGTLSATSSGATIAPAASGLGSFAVFSPNDGLPNYFEMTASVTPAAAAKGGLANGYLIFNYISATNFDYAGVNATTGNIELGTYNGTTWTVEASAAAKISAGTTYNLLLAINGNSATLTVSTSKTSTSISNTYPWNVVDGTNLGLNYGLVGIGTNNATATFNNIVTQVPIPPTTWTYTTFFGSGPLYFDTPTGGTWTTNGTGLTGVPPTGGFTIKPIDPGLALTPAEAPGTFRFQNSSNVDIAATIKFLGGRAGLVFDYSPGAFNFAALLGDTNQVVLGHYTTAGGFVIDEAAKISIGNSPVLEIVANGDSVNVLVNGKQMLSMTYGQVTTDNQFGLLSWTGSNTFNALTVTTNDPGLTGAQNMVAASTPTGPALGETSLTMAEVNSELSAAINRLATTLSLDEKAIAELWATPITIADLPPGGLGATTNGAIILSPNAAGWGWFIDPTPYTDSSFPNVSADGLSAPAGSPASGEMDLLTVEMHELAHVLGYGDTSSGLMSEYLSPGVRLAPAVDVASGIGSHGTAIAAIHAGDPSGQSATDQPGAQGSKSATAHAPASANAAAHHYLRSGAPIALPAGQMVVPQSGSAVADPLPSTSYFRQPNPVRDYGRTQGPTAFAPVRRPHRHVCRTRRVSRLVG